MMRALIGRMKQKNRNLWVKISNEEASATAREESPKLSTRSFAAVEFIDELRCSQKRLGFHKI
jgi:hypothetical protein